MSPLRLNGSTSGYSELEAPAIAGDQTFTLPGTGGTLDRLNRAGNILQVVNATYAMETGNASSTFADTGLTATITPTSSSSKVLIYVTQNGCYKSAAITYMTLKLLRGSTTISDFERYALGNGVATANAVGTCGLTYLDSPATTSAVTYKTQFSNAASAGTVYVQLTSGGVTSVSAMTLMEVAA